MRSCDLTIATQVLEGLSFSEGVLAAGIRHGCARFNYQGRDLVSVEGRGFRLIDQFFGALGVPHHRLELAELRLVLAAEGDGAVLLVCPTVTDRRSLLALAPGSTPFLMAYSTYVVLGVEPGGVRVRTFADGEPEDSTMDWDVLVRLSEVQPRPFRHGLLLLWVPNHRVAPEALDRIAQHRIDRFCVDERVVEECGTTLYGPQAYDSLAEALREWDRLDRVARFLLFQGLLNGSAFYYRKEFADALAEVGGFTETVSALRVAGRLWRDLGRRLRNAAVTDTSLDLAGITENLVQVRDLEIGALSTLRLERHSHAHAR